MGLSKLMWETVREQTPVPNSKTELEQEYIWNQYEERKTIKPQPLRRGKRKKAV